MKHEKPTHNHLQLPEGNELFALQQLYNENFYALLSMARKMLRSQELAEDLVQDVFLTLISEAKNNKLSHVINLKAYLFTIAYNRATKKILELNKEFKATKEYILTVDKSTLQEEPENLKPELLQRLIDKLPPMRRNAFLLVKMEGYTEKAAGHKLSVTEGTVRQHVFRAVTFIKKHSTSLSLLFSFLFVK